MKSPIVGTFYRAAEPGAKDFASVGDTVRTIVDSVTNLVHCD